MLCTKTFCSCEKLFLFHLNEFLGRKIPLLLLNVFEWVRIDRIKYRQIPGCRSFSTTCICITVHHWQQKQCWWGSKIYNIFAAIAVAAAEWCQKAKKPKTTKRREILINCCRCRCCRRQNIIRHYIWLHLTLLLKPETLGQIVHISLGPITVWNMCAKQSRTEHNNGSPKIIFGVAQCTCTAHLFCKSFHWWALQWNIAHFSWFYVASRSYERERER